jgi:hypothetical protein
VGTGERNTAAGFVYQHLDLGPEDDTRDDVFWFVCVGPFLLCGMGLFFSARRCSDLSLVIDEEQAIPWPSDGRQVA